MAAVPRLPFPPRASLRLVVPVLVLLLAPAFLLAGAERVTVDAPLGPDRSAAPAADLADPAGLAAGMADDELVGQVLMPYFYGDRPTEAPLSVIEANQSYAGVDTPAELVQRYRLGGVIVMRRTGPDGAPSPEGNVTSPEQLSELTAGLQAASELPLLVGIDQEYGVVARLTDGVTGLPSAMAAGAAADPGLTEAAWRVAGAELAALGVNLNFAPVADVLGDQRGGVIGSRAYGAEPELVADQVAAVVRGLHATGVAATVKHFPGHGDTAIDSHEALPVVATSQSRLAAIDLPPFRAGLDAGAGLVMTGHLDAQVVEPGLPATFSHAVVTGLLRDELGFTGVAVTDALNMEPALAWSPGEAAVRALLAGNDLLLMPPNLAEAHAGLLAAVADGTLPRSRLREAATRVLALKAELAAVPPPPSIAVVDSEEHHAAVRPLAAAAVTLLRGECGGRLITGPVTITYAGGRSHAYEALRAALTDAGVAVADGDGDEPADGTHVHLVGFGDDESDLDPRADITVAMDTPYLLESADSPTLLATYSSSRASMVGLAAVLTGRLPARGRSPVALRGLPDTACPDAR